MNDADLEKDIQKKLVSLCNFLPTHVETWKNVLKEIINPVKALSNFSEQLCLIEKANIKHMENFQKLQIDMQTKILVDIEVELALTKKHIEKLNKVNHELKNKLSVLEKSTIDLDWTRLDSPLLKGSPTQPPLNKILQMLYEFCIFFSNASKSINNNLKLIDIRNEASLKELEKSVNLGLDKPSQKVECKVYLLLALTQFIINEKAV